MDFLRNKLGWFLFLFIILTGASTLRLITVSNIESTSYGETLIADTHPFVTGNAHYDFIPSNFRTFSSGAGTTGASDQVFKVTSGTALGDFGVIRSFRSTNFKTGQSASIRTGCRFVDNLALTWSGCGGFNVGDEVSFGYNGIDFGVWHRYHGKAEVQDVEITASASGAETVSLTLNGILYSIPVTSGTVQDNAFEIVAYLDANAPELESEQIDDIVRIDYLSDGDKTGTFSCSSTGTLTCTTTEITAGVFKTSDHVAMADWSERPNGFTGFDPSLGNIYQIEYTNGYSDISFYIENPETNRPELVHIVPWTNSKTQPNFGNPNLHVGVYATSIGAVSPIEIHQSSIGGFIHGAVNKTRNPRAFENTKLGVGTTSTNILTIRNSRTYNGLANQVSIEPLFISVTNDGNKQAECELVANPTVGGISNFQEIGSNLISQYDTSGTDVTGGRVLHAFPVARLGSTSVNITSFEIVAPPSLRLVVACNLTSGTGDISASLTWYEDI